MDNQGFTKAAECLKILSHPQRLRLLVLLREGPLRVGEIALSLKLQSHVTSEHLGLMQHCGFLERDRKGRNVHYKIAEPHLLELLKCIESKFGSKEKYGTKGKLSKGSK